MTEIPRAQEPVIGHLEATWASVAELGAGLAPSQWATPTDLPGWSVKDCLSHITGTELMVEGEPAPEVPVQHLAHVRDAFGAAMEAWVEERRGLSGEEVLAEMRNVTARRLARLRILTPAEWDEVGWSPVGEVPYRDFMAVRAFDCWMHEQDMRRALGRAGHMSGPLPALAVQRLGSALGMIVAKRAAAPTGTTVVFEVSGDGGQTFALVVRQRAELLEVPPTDPTVRISTDVETFCILGGGRRSAQSCGDRVETVGDEQIALAILENMAITP